MTYAACTKVSTLICEKWGPLGTSKGLVGEQGAITSCNAFTDGEEQPFETSSLAGITKLTAFIVQNWEEYQSQLLQSKAASRLNHQYFALHYILFSAGRGGFCL